MKETKYSELKPIFRETFADEQAVRKNGGTPVNVVFENGVAKFNGSSGPSPAVIYERPINGYYSVRIVFKGKSIVSQGTIFDNRSIAFNGYGLISYSTTGAISTSSGNIYVNGLPSSNFLFDIKTDLVISNINLKQGSGAYKLVIGANGGRVFGANADIELVEIYKGALTASQIKNLYNGTSTKELVKNNMLLDFDSTNGTIEDRTRKNILTSTAVAIKKVGSKYSASFNGTTSKVDCGSDFIGTKSVTIVGWFKLRAWPISGGAHVLANNKFVLAIYASLKKLQLSSDNVSNSYSGNYSINLNTYYFFSVTRDSSGLASFYIGTLKTPPALNSTANQNSGVPTIGTNLFMYNNSTSTKPANCLAPILKAYEGTLTTDEITRLWSETRKDVQ